MLLPDYPDTTAARFEVHALIDPDAAQAFLNQN
jgi:hypothetical protein